MTSITLPIGDRNSPYQRLATLLLLPIVLLNGQTTNPLELIKQPTPAANERIAYDKEPLQFGELRLPDGAGPFPVAILVHGGCWSAKLGNLPESVTSFELLRPVAAALGERGARLVEYRVPPFGKYGRWLARHLSGYKQSNGPSA